MKIINPHRFAVPAPPVDFDGFGNASRYFDGVSDYIDLGDSDDFSFGDGVNDSPFSVCAWVNMNDATNFRILTKFFQATTAQEWQFLVAYDDRLYLSLYDDNGATRLTRRSNEAYTSNQGSWIHFSCTYNGSSSSSGISLYRTLVGGATTQVDAADVNVGSYTAMHNTTANVHIGRLGDFTATSSYANGKIADVRIYNKELTSVEIQSIADGENITTNLVGHWLKDTPSLLDHIGTNDGTNNGSAFAYDNPSPAVEFGKASRWFDGVNDEVNLGDSDDFSFDNVVNDSPFSVSLWFKSNLPVGNIQTLLAKATSSSAVEYLLNLDVNGKVRLVLHQNNSGYGTYLDTGSTSSYTKDKWHHAVVTYDGSLLATGIKVYVDGVDDTGFNVSGGSYSGQTNTTAELLIGNRNTSSGQEMSGNLADVRIYSSELSPTDVAAIYNGTHVETNLIGHWLTNTNDVKDYAGVNDGSNVGSFYSFDNPLSEGEFGSASRDFNLGTDYVDLGNSTDFDLTSTMTMAFWISPDIAHNGGILSKWTTGAPGNFNNSYTCYLGQDAGNQRVTFLIQESDDSTRIKLDSDIDLPLTEWSHVCCVADGTNMRIYINGVLNVSTTYDGTIKTTTKKLIIGKLREEDNIYPFDGTIADVRLYDTGLLAQDIFDLSRGYDYRTNLVGHWLTNKDDVDDYAGTNHGTNISSTYSQDAPL